MGPMQIKSKKYFILGNSGMCISHVSTINMARWYKNDLLKIQIILWQLQGLLIMGLAVGYYLSSCCAMVDIRPAGGGRV